MQFAITTKIKSTDTAPLIPMDYRRKILSLIKTVLTTYENGAYLPLFYDDTTAQNGLCFAVSLPRYEIAPERQFRLSSPNIKIFLSVLDQLKAVCLLNAFIENTGKEHLNIRVEKIRVVPENEVKLPYVALKFLSPLCLRLHERDGNRDTYVTAESENFAAVFKDNLRRDIVKNATHLVPAVETLQIDTNGLHRSVIRHYDVPIPCSTGQIILAGDPKLLEYIRQNHLGSRRSAGFGFVRLIA